MSTCIERTGALTPPQRLAVEGLVAAVALHDEVRPLNEQAMFALAGRGHVVHWLAWSGRTLVGYAQADRDEHSVQLLVHPEHRRQGIASQLAEQVAKVERTPTWWAFGRLPGADQVARTTGAALGRELLVMERDLVALPPVAEAAPEGVVIRSFQPGDRDALLEVNALAFSHHPEQGEMGPEDFERRTQEAWFDPAGLLVAADDETGAFLGFHWTKTDHMDPAEPAELLGEVYVIGVHPDAAGRGIGRALLSAGLAHLADKGVRRVRLYVEASERRVVTMYLSAGFVEITRDASYTTSAKDTL
ncbi:mycothiol synthase [Luteococcus peritonei]|uniref:Mycothiol acetyltransferase n=1 Tax=Luteococcus peritonei TaxID=88874 RepID=A0ABW4RX76_9ACTN